MAKTEGRILALDVGERRIGIALTDELRLTVRGLPTLIRKNRRIDLETLADLIREHEANLVVVGNPLHMSGEPSEQSARIKRLAERLRSRITVAIEFWDERLTSNEAEQLVDRDSLPRNERRKAVDQTAAMLILESYLNAGVKSPA